MKGNAEIMQLESKGELDTLLNQLANEEIPDDAPTDPNDASSYTRSQSYVEFDEEVILKTPSTPTNHSLD
jgi:hypothetical protein